MRPDSRAGGWSLTAAQPSMRLPFNSNDWSVVSASMAQQAHALSPQAPLVMSVGLAPMRYATHLLGIVRMPYQHTGVPTLSSQSTAVQYSTIQQRPGRWSIRCMCAGWAHAASMPPACSSACPWAMPRVAVRVPHRACTYAAPCHAAPCHAMLRHAMLRHAAPCHAMLRHAMPCHAMPCHGGVRASCPAQP